MVERSSIFFHVFLRQWGTAERVSGLGRSLVYILALCSFDVLNLSCPSLRIPEIHILRVLFRNYISKFLNNVLHCWNTASMSIVTLRLTEIPSHLAGPSGTSLEVSFECQVWLLNLWHLQTLTYDKLQYFF